MPRKKTKTVKLTDAQKRVLTLRWQVLQGTAHNAQNAGWFTRRRALHAYQTAHAVLNHIVVVAFGEGAVLDMTSGEPVVTLP